MSVSRVVNTMVKGCNEKTVQNAKWTYMLCMHLKLVDKIRRRNWYEYFDRYTYSEHWGEKNPSQQKPTSSLPERGPQIEILTLMVHHMTCPKYRTFMWEAMFPVLEKVV